MSFRNSLLFLFIIFAHCLVNYALIQYGIVGGYNAPPNSFGYNVAILGRLNFSLMQHLMGSGSIISDNYVISAAQCFLDRNNELKQMRFSIGAGLTDLLGKRGIFIDVDKIYLNMFDRAYPINDIAVVKLELGLITRNSLFLINIKLPVWGETFVGKFGVVSGFGFNWIRTRIDMNTKDEVRVAGGSTYKLKYAAVEVLSYNQCTYRYHDVDPRKQFCGVMHTSKHGESWGICTLDAGAPLVIDQVLVGIASKNQHNCDDTYFGCLYTNIADFVFFIISVLQEMPFENTLIYSNPQHILPSY